MKIIRLINAADTTDVRCHPDSALLLQGRPLFLPDSLPGAADPQWAARIMLAVKICRLGKNISPKFASRYYDGVTAAMQLTLPANPELESVVGLMDSAIVHGEWLDAAAAAQAEAIEIGAGEVGRIVDPAGVITRAICGLSGFLTFKMGDIILIPADDLTVPVAAPSRIGLTLGGTEVLSQKIV